MNRISRHTMFMQMAEVASRRSTCFRRNVGAIITRENVPISIGWNGAPAGEPHCIGNACVPPGQTGCTRAVHAEVNALKRIPNGMWEMGPFSMYVTESPCPHCARSILESQIMDVYYLNEYRLVEGIDTLIGGGVRVWRVTPSGYLINRRTNELMEE